MSVESPENIFRLGSETEQEGFTFEELKKVLNYQNELVKYETDGNGNAVGINAKDVIKLIEKPLSDDFVDKYPNAYEILTVTADICEKEAFIVDGLTYTIDGLMDQDSVLTAMLDLQQTFLNHGVASSEDKSDRVTIFKKAAIARTNILAYYYWTLQNSASGEARFGG